MSKKKVLLFFVSYYSKFEVVQLNLILLRTITDYWICTLNYWIIKTHPWNCHSLLQTHQINIIEIYGIPKYASEYTFIEYLIDWSYKEQYTMRGHLKT